MSFEVPLAAVGGRRRGWSVAAVLCGGLAIVGFALASGDGSAPSAPSATAPVAVAAAPRDGPSPVPAASQGRQANVARSRSLPADLRCGDVAGQTCLRIAWAALRALPDDAPPVDSAAVWSSILCNDSLDCPADYLRGARPLGSVVLTFAEDGRRIAMNVVDPRRPSAGRDGPRVWIARWTPGPG
jgi:hypothetical protein